MKLDIEDVFALSQELNALNKLDIKKVRFFYGGEEIEVSEKEREDWAFTGLNFKDFVMLREWEESK